MSWRKTRRGEENTVTSWNKARVSLCKCATRLQNNHRKCTSSGTGVYRCAPSQSLEATVACMVIPWSVLDSFHSFTASCISQLGPTHVSVCGNCSYPHPSDALHCWRLEAFKAIGSSSIHHYGATANASAHLFQHIRILISFSKKWFCLF